MNEWSWLGHATESEKHARAYIQFLADTPDIDTVFRLSNDACVILQPVPGEEGDKYVVLANRCDKETWDKFYALVAKHPQTTIS